MTPHERRWILLAGAALGTLWALDLAAQPSPTTGVRRSYIIPAVEIVGFDALLNIFDRIVIGEDFESDFASIRRNLRSKWVFENDPYAINQFGHPYQGSVYHGFARSAGLDFWTSLAYTFAGSAMWEIAGETTPPSFNDQIASGIAGAFLGESFFRIAHLLRENADGRPGPRRLLTSAIVAPWDAFNRRVAGRRFDAVFNSNGAAYYRRLQIGGMGTVQDVRGTTTQLRPNEGVLDVAMEYGLPGPAEYTYERPFDYFALQASASTATGFESIFSRGLLFGARHDIGGAYRGVWGVYGSYDYVAPQIFRISSTALSLGTTSQLWLGEGVALQANALVGAGFAAVGTIHGSREGDYHYGVTPQALLGTRVVLGDRVSLDLTARDYFVSDVRAAATPGHDNIGRIDAAFTVRVQRQQALGIRYLYSRRDASYPDLGRRRQVRGTLGLFFTFLGQDRFGLVDWR